MKKYIDYLFWKRTWFRVFFILIPTWIVPVAYFIGIGAEGSDLRKAYGFFVILLWIACIVDNKEVDCPQNPFINQRHKN